MPKKRTLTPNQVVAYNLRRARELRGWTQQEAADALAPFGFRWSSAAFSAAERSVAGGRVRQFNADELLAFAEVFQLPVGWFFLPPADDPGALKGFNLLVGPGWHELIARLQELQQKHPRQRSITDEFFGRITALAALSVLRADSRADFSQEIALIESVRALARTLQEKATDLQSQLEVSLELAESKPIQDLIRELASERKGKKR